MTRIGMRSTRPLRSSDWLALALILTPAAVSAQDTKKTAAKAEITRPIAETIVNRDAFSGSEIRIAAMQVVNADCTSGPTPLLRIATAPQNGEQRQEEVTVPVDRKASDPRASCNGKPVTAVGVFYKSKDGFTGKDNVVIEVDFKNGNVRRFNYKITVR
jgi:hypothetical protein